MIRRPPRSTLLSLHDALPISRIGMLHPAGAATLTIRFVRQSSDEFGNRLRSEEHTSELQSQSNLVCRLLLEKKKNNTYTRHIIDNVDMHSMVSRINSHC